MKKVIGLLLILALAAALLTGCGGASLKGKWKATTGWTYEFREDGTVAAINVYGDVVSEDGTWNDQEAEIQGYHYTVRNLQGDTVELIGNNWSLSLTRVK